MQSLVSDIGAYYDFVKELGVGTFSKVVNCVHKITGMNVGDRDAGGR
jgi:hypothetical protein